MRLDEIVTSQDTEIFAASSEQVKEQKILANNQLISIFISFLHWKVMVFIEGGVTGSKKFFSGFLFLVRRTVFYTNLLKKVSPDKIMSAKAFSLLPVKDNREQVDLLHVHNL